MPNGLGRLILRGWAPLALIALFALFALLASLVSRRTAPRPSAVESMVTGIEPSDSNQAASARIGTIIATQAGQWMELPGVHGVAEGRTADGKPCILLLVEDPDTPALRALPREYEGFPIRFDVTDTLRGLGGNPR